MTEEEIKQKALEAYPEKFMEEPGFTCVDENATKRAVYAEGLKAGLANSTSLKRQLREAKDKCEEAILKAVNEFQNETGYKVSSIEGVNSDKGIIRMAIKYDWYN